MFIFPVQVRHFVHLIGASLKPIKSQFDFNSRTELCFISTTCLHIHSNETCWIFLSYGLFSVPSPHWNSVSVVRHRFYSNSYSPHSVRIWRENRDCIKPFQCPVYSLQVSVYFILVRFVNQLRRRRIPTKSSGGLDGLWTANDDAPVISFFPRWLIHLSSSRSLTTCVLSNFVVLYFLCYSNSHATTTTNPMFSNFQFELHSINFQ